MAYQPACAGLDDLLGLKKAALQLSWMTTMKFSDHRLLLSFEHGDMALAVLLYEYLRGHWRPQSDFWSGFDHSIEFPIQHSEVMGSRNVFLLLFLSGYLWTDSTYIQGVHGGR